ncbi:hypothetical protein N9B42_02410 [Akkermansiaceae bacterium]|nr:hypothetical protein [Akkermansiaceae bacterium]MDB4388391.1 hypothetical protein [Akkermansiaceae bacterium]
MNSSTRKLFLGSLWLLPLGIGFMIGRGMEDENRLKITSTEKTTSPVSHSPSFLAESNSESRPTPKEALHGSIDARREQALTQIADILNTSNRVERTRELLDFIDRLGPSDFEAVVSGFSEAGWVDFNRGEFSFLLTSWMSLDPHAAIAYLETNEEDGWSRKVAISAWAAENPEAAAKAIEGLEDGGKVNDWVVGLIQGMARNDPGAALLTLQGMPMGDTRRTAIREMLPEVVSRGTEFAGEWIEMIDDPKLQSDTAKRLGSALAKRDPESASDWVTEMTTVRSRRDASGVVGEIYASQDVDAAKDWAETLPQDTLTEAAEGVAKHLARRDPAEAAQWLQKLGNDPDLDGARVQFIRESMKSAPEVTLANIPTLSKAADQEHYYRHVLGNWKRNDQQAAIEWARHHSEALSERVYNSIVPKNLRDM